VELLEPVDTIVLGRKLAEGFIPYWAGVADDDANPEQASGRQFTELPKVVFTRTLDTSEWPNTVLAKGDLTDEINNLKAKNGKDIIAYGGSAFVSSLIKQNLIDDYHLFINPTALGTGMPIFKELDTTQNLKLVKSTSFDCGVVVLNYEPKHS